MRTLSKSVVLVLALSAAACSRTAPGTTGSTAPEQPVAVAVKAAPTTGEPAAEAASHTSPAAPATAERPAPGSLPDAPTTQGAAPPEGPRQAASSDATRLAFVHTANVMGELEPCG